MHFAILPGIGFPAIDSWAVVMEPLLNPPATSRLLNVCRTIFRHRVKSSLAFLVVVSAFSAAAILWPRTYASEAKLAIRVPGGTTLGNAATTYTFVAADEARRREVTSLQEILTSRDLLASVVDALGVDAVLGTPPAKREDRVRRDKAISRLATMISCEAPSDSHVVVVRSHAAAPELAQRILQEYLHAYFERPIQVAARSSAHEFLLAQSNQSYERLSLAKQALHDAKNKLGLVSIEGQRRMLETELSNLHIELLATQAERASALANIAEIQREHPDLASRDEATATEGLAVPLEELRAELTRLEFQKRDLQSRLSPRHPRVVAVVEQVAAARISVAQIELAAAESQLTAIRAKTENLAERSAKAQTSLRALNASEVKVQEISRRVAQLDESYQRYVNKLEQARIERALADQPSSNIDIAQAPSLTVHAIRPNVALVIMLGVWAGVFAGVGAAYLSEYLDDSFRSPAEVERALDLPVVLSLPSSPRFFSISSEGAL